MAKVIGLDILLYANTGTPGSPVYTLVGGQTDATINLDADAIDVTSKDGDGWKEIKAGLRGWSIDADAVIKESDTAIAALRNAFMNKEAILVRMVFPDGTTYTGNAYVTSAPIKTPQGGAGTYTFKLEGNGPLTEQVGVSVDKPTVTDPTNGATGVSVTNTCTSSAFAVTGGSDTHANSQWQIAPVADTTFSTPVLDTLSPVDLVSMTIPGGVLSATTEYRIRVRHQGATVGWSDWSDANTFTTA